MSENKNKKNNEKVENKATQKPASKEKNESVEPKKVISQKNLAVIITAGILVVILGAAGIFALVDAISRDAGFDYIKADLTKYIEFTDDYKNFTINVDIAKPV